MAQLRYVVRLLDAASQRHIMRTYGAEFAFWKVSLLLFLNAHDP